MEVADGLVNILGNLCFGWLFMRTGSYQAGLEVLFSFSLLGVLLFSLLIFFAYRWQRIDFFDETVAAYQSPWLNKQYSPDERAAARLGLGGARGEPEVSTEQGGRKFKLRSKEYMGLTDREKLIIQQSNSTNYGSMDTL
jgi:hypothetical protein